MSNFKTTIKTVVSGISPTIGICLFFVFFVYSASLYPGGSQANLKSVGYSWQNNYWCELMNVEAMNGNYNPAVPFAVSGIVFLSIGLSSFFYQLPNYCPTSTFKRKLVRFCGVVGTIFATLLFTSFHDQMLIGFSVFTFITIVTALIILNENKEALCFWTGVISILMVQVNNYMYYLRVRVDLIPVIQKLTIVLVLVWVSTLNLYFYFRKMKKKS